MSTQPISPIVWNTLRAALAAVVGLLVLGAALSLSGVGDPTYGWVTTTTPELTAVERGAELTVWQFAHLPASAFIIEASLDAGPARWGVEIGVGASGRRLLVDPQGYVSDQSQPDWRPFIHVRPDGNRILVQVGSDGRVVWRVNDEIAWSGAIDNTALPISIVLPSGTTPDDVEIALFVPNDGAR